MKTYEKQGGMSLIELMIVVALAAIALVAVMRLYPRVVNGMSANRMTTDVLAITAGVREFTGHRPQYTNASIVEGLINAKKVPESMINDARDGLVSQFAGDVHVSGDGSVFNIAYNDVPAGVCQSVVMNLVSNFKAVSIGTTEASGVVSSPGTPNDDTIFGPGKATPAKVAEQCAAADELTIIFNAA